MEYSKRSIIFDICIMLLSISVIIILSFNLATNIKQNKNNSNTTNNVISYDIALKDYECKDEYKANTFVIQSMEELSYVIQTKKDLTLFIGRSTCPDCKREYPVIAEQYYNKGETLYYFNPESYKNYDFVIEDGVKTDKVSMDNRYITLIDYLFLNNNKLLTTTNFSDDYKYIMYPIDELGIDRDDYKGKLHTIEGKEYIWIYVPMICYINDMQVSSFEIKG